MNELADTEEVLERLELAKDAYRSAASSADAGEDPDAVVDAYERASSILDSYEDQATGTGRETFRSYLELEGTFSSFVEGLASDLPHRESFEDALEAIDKRRLQPSDFERARTALDPAKRTVERIRTLESAQSDLRDARRAAESHVAEIEREIHRQEKILDYEEVDFDAPIDRLHEPIRSYNDAITTAFDTYVHDEPARAVFDLIDRSRLYPLVEFERPPADLERFITNNTVGERSIPELLELAEYSRTKLAHIVDDPDTLKRNVATQRTYLRGIDGDPLTISWPPPPAQTTRYYLRERQPFVSRIDDPTASSAYRETFELTFDPDFDELRSIASAADQLSESDRRRLESGEVKERLTSLRRELDRLRAAIEDDPISQ